MSFVFRTGILGLRNVPQLTVEVGEYPGSTGSATDMSRDTPNDSRYYCK